VRDLSTKVHWDPLLSACRKDPWEIRLDHLRHAYLIYSIERRQIPLDMKSRSAPGRRRKRNYAWPLTLRLRTRSQVPNLLPRFVARPHNFRLFLRNVSAKVFIPELECGVGRFGK
jgi:hypothetical protein